MRFPRGFDMHHQRLLIEEAKVGEGEQILAGTTTGLQSDRHAAVALTNVDVTFRLTGGGSYLAVEGATLNVADGEFVAIVGPTGCGKSTLLSIAAGLIAPAAGR